MYKKVNIRTQEHRSVGLKIKLILQLKISAPLK